MGTLLGNSCVEGVDRIQKINTVIDYDNMKWIELAKSTSRILWEFLF